jgi:hypothetical protein
VVVQGEPVFLQGHVQYAAHGFSLCLYAALERIMKTPVELVNTLEQHNLEKFYSATQIFKLPSDYTEKYSH